jgi:nucleotide-binding universal stress UspA family protein
MVVMATRAPGAVDRVLHDSIADEVMRDGACPVVLVPPGTDYMRDKDVQLGRVLVPLDGSALAERALEFLLALPAARQLELALVTVLPPGADRHPALDRLAAVAKRLRDAGARAVEYDVCESADPADAVLAAVRETLVDMIAMSSRGNGGIRRLVLGSVAEGVVRGSEVPVLLLTPRSLAPSDPA